MADPGRAALRRPNCTLVTLSHPDAARPRRRFGRRRQSRTRGLGIRGETSITYPPPWRPTTRFARLALGGTISARSGMHPAIDLKEWVTRRTNMTLPELATKFESIGDNCEFGLVQRRCDTEPLEATASSPDRSPTTSSAASNTSSRTSASPTTSRQRLEGDEGKREFMIHEPKYGLLCTPSYTKENGPWNSCANKKRHACNSCAENSSTNCTPAKKSSSSRAQHRSRIGDPAAMAWHSTASNPTPCCGSCQRARTFRRHGRGADERTAKGYINRFAPSDNAHRFRSRHGSLPASAPSCSSG